MNNTKKDQLLTYKSEKRDKHWKNLKMKIKYSCVKAVCTNLPNNLIEVPPVSFQSFMLKCKNKEGGNKVQQTIKQRNNA